MGGYPFVIGIMVSGHLANRYGVPHKLEGLGLNSTVLLPWTLGWDCNELRDNYADAIFGLEAMESSPRKQRPVLGIRIEKIKNTPGVLVDQVVEKSVAEKAGFKKGDRILSAAGQDIEDTGQLISIIQRQAPGTWLPLDVVRHSKHLEIIAKFPNRTAKE
jgi:predicted metalloprotease with PDZ domain